MGIAGRRAVFLDRDGVINRAIVREGRPYAAASPAELQILPEVPEALAELKRSGFLLFVVTNQPDVGRGMLRREVVEYLHEMLTAALPLDSILVCYHSDEDRCSCRKTLPGLLLEAAREYAIDLKQSFMVGDRWRDIEAGYNAGCKTIFIDRGYRERGTTREPDVRVKSLRQAAGWILASLAIEVEP
jgi:D-glycero-D-manno-heptose 1,7-bisphosphate phosphatase